MIDFSEGMLKFKVAEYLIMFPNNIIFNIFNDPENYYGILFTDKIKGTYEIVESKLGTRLLINNKDGVKDIPFNKGTAHFLPTFIKVKTLKDIKHAE